MKAKIVGCGLSGITAAILLREKGWDVTIFETRSHIGGNCYDTREAGTLMHVYGPHIFHTDDEEVFSFLSKYTEWRPFFLRPKGNTKLGLISLPYSKKTQQELGRSLSQEEIVDVIFRDYSEKQWGVPFDSIPRSITNRIPKTAECSDPTWFEGQKYQCVPKHGYTKMMENMLEGFDLRLGCEETAWKKEPSELTVFTGKIDSYFNFCYGRLPYRSLDFVHKHSEEKMGHFIQNENNRDVSYTRKYDHSYFSEAHEGYTVITEEYPKACGEGDTPFYPIPFGEGLKTYARYKELAEKETGTIFLGRLATYSYLDMWMAVKQAIIKIQKIHE